MEEDSGWMEKQKEGRGTQGVEKWTEEWLGEVTVEQRMEMGREGGQAGH
jgi:hypothetical protein